MSHQTGSPTDAQIALAKLKSRLRLQFDKKEDEFSPSVPYDFDAQSLQTSAQPKKSNPPSGKEVPGQVLPYMTSALEDSYSLGPKLGKGGTAIVRIVQEVDSGKLRACKTICKKKLEKPLSCLELRGEIRALQWVGGHRHVVQLRGLFEDRTAVHLILDLCAGGELYAYMKGRGRLEEGEAARIFRQVALALEHCHRRGVMHRDVKPENILISGRTRNLDGSLTPQVKLADFGLAVRLGPSNRTATQAGSSAYMAPEIVAEQEYGYEADMWSLGVVIYIALSGFMPFWGRDNDETFTSICMTEANYTHQPWPSISDEAKDLVKKLLNSNPKDRLSASSVLSHPWIKKYNIFLNSGPSPRTPSPRSPCTAFPPLPESPPPLPHSLPSPRSLPSPLPPPIPPMVYEFGEPSPRKFGSKMCFISPSSISTPNLKQRDNNNSNNGSSNQFSNLFQRNGNSETRNSNNSSINNLKVETQNSIEKSKCALVIPPRLALEFGFNVSDQNPSSPSKLISQTSNTNDSSQTNSNNNNTYNTASLSSSSPSSIHHSKTCDGSQLSHTKSRIGSKSERISPSPPFDCYPNSLSPRPNRTDGLPKERNQERKSSFGGGGGGGEGGGGVISKQKLYALEELRRMALELGYEIEIKELKNSQGEREREERERERHREREKERERERDREREREREERERERKREGGGEKERERNFNCLSCAATEAVVGRNSCEETLLPQHSLVWGLI